MPPKETPGFPLPPKAPTGTAYRAPAPKVPGAAPPAPIIVTRPEAPEEVVPTPPKKPVVRPVIVPRAALFAEAPLRDRFWAFVGRRPRLSGLLGAALFGYLAIGGAISDAAVRRGGVGWVHKPGVLPVFAGFATASLWLLVFGAPLDEERNTLPDWWKYGLALAVVAALAGFSEIAVVITAL